MAYSYARRVELAKLRGFGDPSGRTNPYVYYRAVSEYVRDDALFSEETGVETAREDFAAASLFYEAFERGDEDDYSIHVRDGEIVVEYVDGKPVGAKAKLLIDIFGYVTDPAAWRELYPTQTRFGHLLPEGTVIKKPQRPSKTRHKPKSKKRSRKKR